MFAVYPGRPVGPERHPKPPLLGFPRALGGEGEGGVVALPLPAFAQTCEICEKWEEKKLAFQGLENLWKMNGLCEKLFRWISILSVE